MSNILVLCFSFLVEDCWFDRIYDYFDLFIFNFIYFTTITKQVIPVVQLKLIMLVGTDVCVLVVSVLEETHLSDLVTTWPSHMPVLGIEPGPQWWEVSMLPLRQPDNYVDKCASNMQGSIKCKRCAGIIMGFGVSMCRHHYGVWCQYDF